MEYFFKYTVLCLSIGMVMPKDLHIKEVTNTMAKNIKKDFSIDLMNIYENNDIFTKNERFVRHVEVVTESLLEHLLKEIKGKYAAKGAKNFRETRLMHNLRNALKKRVNAKRRRRPNHIHKKTTGKSVTIE